jgi:anaerobic selenocysteine-containing dehydrogenase
VTVEDGRAVALRGVREHPFTRGALCGKVNRYLDAVYGEDRLLHPLRRVGPKGENDFERISWEEALAEVAGRLRETIDCDGPEAILPFYFAGTMGHVQGWSLGPRLFARLGTSRLETTICTGAATAALQETLGACVGMDPEDVAHANLVIVWGCNILSANVHQWRFVLEARERGAHVVCIDPIRSETAERCDEHLAPRPGTDAALAFGLMRAVLDAGAEDRDWLERHTVGWPDLEARLAEWPVERAAAVCGLPVEDVRRLGARLAATRPTAIRVGLGLQRHGGGGAIMRAILALPAVTGDWRYVGGGCVSQTDDHAPLGSVFSAGMPRPAARSVNMSRLAEALLDLDDPPVRALVVFDANPAATVPDQHRVRAGLLRDDLFTVVLEQRLTDTTAYADVVLPATMQLEHADLHTTYGHLYVAWNEPALEPPGEALPNTEIFRRLARALGLTEPALYDSDLELARQLLDTDGFRAAGVTLGRLREAGFLRAAHFPAGVAPYADGGFPTPDGRVRLGGIDYVAPHEASDEALAARYPLVLIAPAGRFFLNSTFASLPWHRRRMGPPRVYLHPEDAAARGIEEGDDVRVHNGRGEFRAAAVVTDAARPGVAFTYKCYWPGRSEGGTNVNATTPERDADLGGGPTFHDNRVEVVGVRTAARAAAREAAETLPR